MLGSEKKDLTTTVICVLKGEAMDAQKKADDLAEIIHPADTKKARDWILSTLSEEYLAKVTLTVGVIQSIERLYYEGMDDRLSQQI